MRRKARNASTADFAAGPFVIQNGHLRIGDFTLAIESRL